MTSAPSLCEGYEIRELSDDEFTSYWDAHAEKIFDDDSQIFRVFDFLTDQEKAKARVLRGLIGTPYQLRLGFSITANSQVGRPAIKNRQRPIT